MKKNLVTFAILLASIAGIVMALVGAKEHFTLTAGGVSSSDASHEDLKYANYEQATNHFKKTPEPVQVAGSPSGLQVNQFQAYR